MNAIVEHKQTPTAVFRDQFQRMDGEIGSALPPHIPVERFMRVVLTAVNATPDLLNADRRSLMAAAMKAAQDGLLPDGRDGALVVFGKQVQWMPMVGGILKKVRNSGELVSISAHVAYEHDEFTYELGDDEKIIHRPSLGDRGKARLVYAIARTKDGGVYRDIMTVSDVEKVRNVSRAKNNGPWVTWWDEMAKKTVLRRLSKRLPMSSDLDDLIRRDDELYDLKRGHADEAAARLFQPVENPLSDEAPPAPAEVPHDPETGEVKDANGKPEEPATEAAAPAPAAEAQPAKPAAATKPDVDEGPDKLAIARQRGAEAKQKKMSRKATPGEYREGRPDELAAYLDGYDSWGSAPADDGMGVSG